MLRLLLNTLMILFLLGLRPVDAMTVKQCDAMSDLVGHAMDLRASGVPLQHALDRYDMEPEPLEVWQNIAMTAYSLDQQFLSGSQRADLLTQLYAQCLGAEEEPS